MSEYVLAWHFVRGDRTLRDGNTVEAGYVYSVPPEDLALCSWGLHASVNPLDALKYAPGSIICRVECRGRVVHSGDKLVCSEREVLWVANAEAELRAFARWCALRVTDKWGAPDVVRRYLETGDETIRAAAWDASRAASRAAPGDAAWDASRVAAWDASRVAAWAAAWAASWAASWAAAWEASVDSARAASGDAAWEASVDSARAASGDASRAAESAKLTEVLDGLAP